MMPNDPKHFKPGVKFIHYYYGELHEVVGRDAFMAYHGHSSDDSRFDEKLCTFMKDIETGRIAWVVTRSSETLQRSKTVACARHAALIMKTDELSEQDRK